MLRQVWDKTSLVTQCALITHLSVFITNDTGLAHIAYALATPTVTIFGGGSPLLNGPCRPCGYQTCPIGYVCLDGVRVEHAMKVASEIMR